MGAHMGVTLVWRHQKNFIIRESARMSEEVGMYRRAARGVLR